MIIRVNQGPTGGNSSVTPTRGTALVTTFTLLSLGWRDAEGDYPLTYSYSFYSAGTTTTLSSARNATHLQVGSVRMPEAGTMYTHR